jgi:hypothetical protein
MMVLPKPGALARDQGGFLPFCQRISFSGQDLRDSSLRYAPFRMTQDIGQAVNSAADAIIYKENSLNL